MKQIFIAGFPSLVGGADTELFHNIDLWLANGVDVRIVPMFGADKDIKRYLINKGCRIYNYHPSIFKDKIVVSFCNGQFLEKLPEIAEHGKPSKVIWFNCMTWLFDNEIKAHKNGLIDIFGFVSDYQKNYLLYQLEKHNKVTVLDGYKPYFNPDHEYQKINFEYRKPDEYFGLGRVSRGDPAKFSEDMWDIFYKVNSPIHKKVFVLGYDQKVEKKTNPPPPRLDWMYWSAGAIPVSDLYKKIHCIIHKTGGSRESYCRVVPEAYAFGVPIIVERNYAFPELIINGETGWMCDTSDEMSFRASELAFDEEKRKKMIFQAKDHLANNIANKDKCWEVWRDVL